MIKQLVNYTKKTKMSKTKKSINVKSLEVILYITKEYWDVDVDTMEEQAREYGLNPEIKELKTEHTKFHPGLPYFATDYGTYPSFESLLEGFRKKGIILKKIKKKKNNIPNNLPAPDFPDLLEVEVCGTLISLVNCPFSLESA